jgi:hypothetical protein
MPKLRSRSLFSRCAAHYHTRLEFWGIRTIIRKAVETSQVFTARESKFEKYRI